LTQHILYIENKSLISKFDTTHPLYWKSKQVKVTNYDVSLFSYFDVKTILRYLTLACCKYFMMKFVI